MRNRSSQFPGPFRRTLAQAISLTAVGVASLISTSTLASPGVDGTRNLGLSRSARASAAGIDAALANPAALPVTPMFELAPLYQIRVHDRTHGLGFFIMDSLNNPRLAVGLGYAFFRGSPRVGVPRDDGTTQTLELSHLGHEGALAISVVAIPNWLAIGLKPKYQYTSLRYLDDDGVARDAHDKLEAFGLDASLIFVGGRWMRIALVAENLVGNHAPPFDADNPLALQGVDMAAGLSLDPNELRRVSDYPLLLTHSVAVYPVGSSKFNLNVDASYDLTSYADQGRVRPLVGGGAEFIVGPVPLRLGAQWDGAGRGNADDGVFVSAGVAYQREPPTGGLGADIGVGVVQQVTGEQLTTIVGINLGLRVHPDL